jgi:hypothetical protein
MGFFTRSKFVQGYAKTAEIYPSMEDGNYKAFIVKVQVDNNAFSSALGKAGQNELETFIKVIDDRIRRKDFDDPLLFVERIYGPDATLRRNYDAERIVISSNEKILFGWNDEK